MTGQVLGATRVVDDRPALADPALHAALENAHIVEAGAAQDVRHPGGAPVGASNRDEKTSSPAAELGEMPR